MSSLAGRSVPLPKFEGSVAYEIWWTQFYAYAGVAKFTAALRDGGEPLPADDTVVPDEGTAPGRQLARAKERNALAMACLTIALTRADDMTLVFESKTTEWPGGLAHLVVAALKEKYQPEDITTTVERQREINKIKMKATDPPNKLFEQLSAVNNKFLNRLPSLTKAEQIALVVEKAPKEYQALLLLEQKRLNATSPNGVSVKQLQLVMNELYRTTHDMEENEDDEENENTDKGEVLLAMLNGKSTKEQQEMLLALVNNDFSCYTCGEKGHKSFNCPNKGTNNNNGSNGNGNNNNSNNGNNGNNNNNNNRSGGRFSGKCNLCGRIGHKADRCWEKDENKHLRPSWYIVGMHRNSGGNNNNRGNSGGGYRGNEQGNAAVGGSNIEMLLATADMCLPTVDMALAGPDTSIVIEKGGIQISGDITSLKRDNLWIADTGATMHSTPHNGGFDKAGTVQTNETITVGNGSGEKAKGIGRIKGTITDKWGTPKSNVALDEVALIPTAAFNLFSETKMVAKGWDLKGNKEELWLEEGDKRITFDIKIKTAQGVLYCLNLKRNYDEVAAAVTNTTKRMNINLLHQHLGHCNEADARLTAKCLDIDITRGTLKPCEACAKAKAKQKSVPKETDHIVASKDDERRMFLDISTIKRTDTTKPKVIYKGNWRMMVDEQTQLKFTDFFKTKDAMVEPTCEQLNRFKVAGKEVKYLRMDNAGENKKLEKRARSAAWKLDFETEYTARNTPQQNHLVELGFAIIGSKSRAMMIAAGIPEAKKHLLAKEAIRCATQLDGLMTMTLNNKTATRYEHYGGDNPRFAHHMQVWGEAGTVTLKNDKTPKLANRGETCMMVGYALNHTGDTYRMWNPETNGVHETRDITWLNRMYYVQEETLPVVMTNIETGESSNKDDVALPNEAGESDAQEPDAQASTGNDNNNNDDRNSEDDATDSEDEPENEPVITRSGRVSRPSTRLIEELGAIATGEFALGAISQFEELIEDDNDDTELMCDAERNYFDNMMAIDDGKMIAGEILASAVEMNGGLEEDFQQYAMGILSEVIAVGAGLGGGFENTNELKVMKYDEAMSTADRDKWDTAVNEEHDRMVKHRVWKAVLKKDIPATAKILTSTWAMKKKSNGVYRARMNARGFEQIEGEHYDKHDIAASVTNDITIRIVLVMMIMAGWVGELLDIKGAFLHGDFNKGKNLFMEIPKGFEKFYDKRYYVLYLLKTIYGLKQAAMAFWKQLLKCFKSMRYKRSKADPCLYYRWTKGGLVIWISWIDDCLVVGSKRRMLSAKKKMIQRFDCDIVGNMNEYVGCKLDRDWKERSIRFSQPVMIQSFKDEFDILNNMKIKTPAEPGTVLVKCDEKNGLTGEMMSTYQSGVGKLLHMMRWSRPDILNATRELSKHMKVASLAHLRAMERVMTYVASTPLRGLTLKPNDKWDGNKEYKFVVSGMSDSDYAKDPDSRRSISGTSVFLNGAPVCMRSGQQNMTTLSSAEAELVAGTQCAQDMLYVKRILESMGLKIEEPMILQIDNRGAVDLANNWSIGGRTRHIEVRQYFLRELKEAGIIHTRWISGGLMSSDLFTKNLPGAIFDRHTKRYCGVDEYHREYMGSQGESVGM